MTIDLLPQALQGLLIGLMLLALCSLIGLVLIRHMLRQTPINTLLFPVLIIVFQFLILAVLTEKANLSEHETEFSYIREYLRQLPVYIYFLWLGIVCLYLTIAILKTRHFSRNVITDESYKDGLDHLPMGFSFSDKAGNPLHVNLKMHELSRSLSGTILRNNKNFHQLIRETEASQGCIHLRGKQAPIWQLQDGRVWAFSISDVCVKGHNYVRTLATDVTDVWQASERIQANTQIIQERLNRYRLLLKEIVQYSEQEELLASRALLHHEFGSCLLLSWEYLSNETEMTLSDLRNAWHKVIHFSQASLLTLDGDVDEEIQELLQGAKLLGCTIEIVGSFPQEKQSAYLALSVLREAVTNAVRHAQATYVKMSLIQVGPETQIKITDNGSGSEGTIREGEGLSTLRKRIEMIGGELMISSGIPVTIRARVPHNTEV